MVCSAPSGGSKEANDWTIAVVCAFKRAHELSVHVACRAPVTRAHSKFIHFQRAYAKLREVAMKLTWI